MSFLEMSSPEPRAQMITALRRLAAAEPDLGAVRSANWRERVLALRELRAAVALHAREQRDRGIPIERVIVELKAMVTTTLRAAHPEMEPGPIRDKVVTWCSTAYFLDPEEDGTTGCAEPR